MILVVDNYDSFTWNIVHYLQAMNVDVRVERNDAITALEAMALNAEAYLISPGPCTPNEAGISLALVQACATRHRPLLGVCLGHQAIGQTFGAVVGRASRLMHGKTSNIVHEGTGVFRDVPSPFMGTRYHSLSLHNETVPSTIEVNAWGEDGTIMGIRHRSLPIHGVQYHPESVCSEYGYQVLANFLALAGIAYTIPDIANADFLSRK